MQLKSHPALRRAAWRMGRRLYLEARGEPIQNQIAINGEADLQASVLNLSPAPGPLQFVDIGGNVGEWTVTLLRQQEKSPRKRAIRIDAFEPVSAAADAFEAAIAALDTQKSVHLHRLALSDKPGQGRMAIEGASAGTNRLQGAFATPAPAGGFVDVTLDTLTGFCHRQGIEHIHFAKCDAEGHDAKILLGARDLLAASRIDVFQFEYNHRWVSGRSYLRDVYELIAGLPYQVARVAPKRLEMFPDWHPELERFFEANYALVHKSALDWLPTRTGSFDASNTYA